MQDYPKDRYEVLVADGESTDTTREILKNYDVVLLENPARDCDDGKYVALERAKGEIVALIDADNIIAENDWLKKMVQPFADEAEIMGVESNYLIADDFTPVNTYANLLVIVDPLARMLASKPYKVKKKNGFNVKYFKKGSAPVAGANGFLWRKQIVDKYNNHGLKKFAEANLLAEIAQKTEVSYANIPNVGIYHYYCEDLKDYIAKRKKIARKFLGRRGRKEDTWVDGRGSKKLYLSAFYLGTFIGPTIEAIICAVKERRYEWCLHPLISCATVYTYAVNLLTKR
jgi:glycosyltransferase involved in cell wall biosynthesis